MWQKAVPDLRTQLDSVRLAAEWLRGAVTCPSVPGAERTPPLAADPLALPLSMAVCADAAAMGRFAGLDIDHRACIGCAQALLENRHVKQEMHDLQRLHSKFKVRWEWHCCSSAPNAQPRTLRTGNTRAGGLRQVTWVPNEWVEKCINCSAEFSIFKWKNHCRLCGRSGALLDQWIRARHSSAGRPAALPTCGYACATAPRPADSDTAG